MFSVNLKKKKKKTKNHPIYFAILRKKTKKRKKHVTLWNFSQFMIDRLRCLRVRKVINLIHWRASQRRQIQVMTRNFIRLDHVLHKKTSPSYLFRTFLDDNSTHFSSFRIHLMCCLNTTIWLLCIYFCKKSPFMPKHFWSKCAIYNL